MDSFDDIRPYLDHEVSDAIGRLADDDEFVSVALTQAPAWARRLQPLGRALVRFSIRRAAQRTHSVEHLQQIVSRHIARLLEATSDGLTVSGLDHIDPGAPHLFVSNHRDIVLDPTLLNYALHRAGRSTSAVAIGDNLLGTGYRSTLMRLNKAFVVQREVVGAKAQLESMRRTSQYLRRTLEAGSSVWIAQGQGRSKDGVDRTEPALVKMFMLAYRDTASNVDEWLGKVRLTPVSISYEIDPCAPLKARELHQTASEGSYRKPPGEDARSIETGVFGFKGRIQLCFSRPLGHGSSPEDTPPGGFETAEALAEAIDRRIAEHLAIYPTHHYARARLAGQHPDAATMAANVREAFLQGLANCPGELEPHLLRQYANQIENRLGFGLE